MICIVTSYVCSFACLYKRWLVRARCSAVPTLARNCVPALFYNSYVFVRARWLPRSPFSFIILICAGVCRAWRDLITNNGKLWDQCVGMCGVSATVRAKFWSWLTGAAGKGVPAWRCDDMTLHCNCDGWDSYVVDGVLS